MTPQHGRHRDHELDELFADDPDLLRFADQARSAPPRVPLDQYFQMRLRKQLMEAAQHELRSHGWRAWMRPRAGALAFAGATLGAAMIAIVVVSNIRGVGQDKQVVAYSTFAGQNAVNTNDDITVSFDRAMDHTAVQSGLSIHPATAVTTQWNGNTLVITPVHHLTGNVPYNVSIAKSAARGQDGTVAPADIHIMFATAPTPTAAPTATPTASPSSGPPPITVHTAGNIVPGTAIAFAPNNDVVITDGFAPSTSPSPAPSPSSSASPSPLAGNLLRIAQDGTVTKIGDVVGAIAYSQSGQQIAYTVPQPSGGAKVTVAQADGTQVVQLATTDTTNTPLAWTKNNAVLYVSGGQIRSVDLQQRTSVVAPQIHISANQHVVLATGGHYAFITPTTSPTTSPTPTSPTGNTPSPSPGSTNGTVTDLSTQQSYPLAGSSTMASFNQDGTQVAWLDAIATPPAAHIAHSSDGFNSTTTVPLTGSTSDTVTSLALSPDGTQLLFAEQSSGGKTVNVAAADGHLVATASASSPSNVTWSNDGTHIAYVDGTNVQVATTGQQPTQPSTDTPSQTAISMVYEITQAQVLSNGTLLDSLSAPGVPLKSQTPASLSRSYLINATQSADTNTVTASVRLVRDATSGHPTAAYADETLTLTRTDTKSAYLVTHITISSVTNEPNGPQIVHVASSITANSTVVTVSFDSDLDPSTVPGAISAQTSTGTQLHPTVAYQADQRVITVTLPSMPGQSFQLSVDSSLHDVAGQSFSPPYQTTIQG